MKKDHSVYNTKDYSVYYIIEARHFFFCYNQHIPQRHNAAAIIPIIPPEEPKFMLPIIVDSKKQSYHFKAEQKGEIISLNRSQERTQSEKHKER